MNPAPVEVRQVSPEDRQTLQGLIDLEQESFGKDGLSVFNLSLFARGGLLLALFENGRPIGEAQVIARPGENGAFLFGLAVAASQRGKGHGRLLLAETLSLLQARGCRWVELTVAVGNTAARRLYEEGFGFVQVACFAGLHPDDEERLVLRKEPG